MGMFPRKALMVLALAALGACSSLSSLNPLPLLGLGGGGGQSASVTDTDTPTQQATRTRDGVAVAVNRDLWNASLDVLSFLPIQSVDPFTGVIITGFGTPPGGSRSYKATVFVQSAELDARSLKVAIFTQSGPASSETARAVEDAILTRARQLRAGAE